MMRLQTTLVTGIAAFLVAPGLTQSQGELKALEEGLAATERSLEILRGFEKHSERNAGSLPALILAATEPSHVQELGLSDRLEKLRLEVSLLQMNVDAIEGGKRDSGMSDVPAHDPHRNGAPRGPTHAAPYSVPHISTGLDEALRMRMQGRLKPAQTMPEPTKDSETMKPDGQAAPTQDAPNQDTRTAVDPPRVAIEFEGYSADPMGQAQACYHAGRYADCLMLLEGLKDTSANHLRSRSLDRLERYDEAIKSLMQIIEVAGDSYEGKRARTDLEFIRWKRDFAKKLPRSAEGRSGS